MNSLSASTALAKTCKTISPQVAIPRPCKASQGKLRQVDVTVQGFFGSVFKSKSEESGTMTMTLPGPHQGDGDISLEEITSARAEWIAACKARDVDSMVALYHPEEGRLLGTIDTMDSEERTNLYSIRKYFDNFLGSNDSVEPRFAPRIYPHDVIQLGNSYCVYNGYYTFRICKGDEAKIANAKFSYIYKRTADGLKIVTHNSGLTPVGVEIEGIKSGDVTVAEVYSARGRWIEAVRRLDIPSTVMLYHPEEGKLLGTIDNEESIKRGSHEAITKYFEVFLGSSAAVEPDFPVTVTEDNLVQLGNGYAAYNGYYTFMITSKKGVTKQAKAKFTYIYKRTKDGLKIVTHNSGLTPEGVTVVAGDNTPVDKDEILLARQNWIKAARDRNVDAMVALYDPQEGRLLGTIDDRETMDRTNPAAIRTYFEGFLGGNDAVIADFDPIIKENDIIQLGSGYVVYNGYYDFTLKKDGTTKLAHAKFSYIYRKTNEGLKIVTHNSGLTPEGIEIVDQPVEYQPPITAAEVRQAVDKWVAAVSARNVPATVALYDSQSARLLGTIDSDETEARTSVDSIQRYFANFLGNNDMVVPMFPQVTESDIIQVGDGHAIYNGYYEFNIAKDGNVKTAHAKFSYVYKRTPDGLKIVTHNSGLTPEGIQELGSSSPPSRPEQSSPNFSSKQTLTLSDSTKSTPSHVGVVSSLA